LLRQATFADESKESKEAELDEEQQQLLLEQQQQLQQDQLHLLLDGADASSSGADGKIGSPAGSPSSDPRARGSLARRIRPTEHLPPVLDAFARTQVRMLARLGFLLPVPRLTRPFPALTASGCLLFRGSLLPLDQRQHRFVLHSRSLQLVRVAVLSLVLLSLFLTPSAV
jgi:hypothetical protein